MNVELNAPSLNYHSLFKSLPGLFVVLSADTDVRILEASGDYLKTFSVLNQEIIGRRFFDAFRASETCPESNVCLSVIKEALANARAQKKPQRIPIQRFDLPKANHRSNNGQNNFETRYWTGVQYPILDQHEQVLYILQHIEDVTESVLAEHHSAEKIRQSQRMEAMGQLAGGVAHDFNNMLAIMIMKCDTMIKKFNLDEASYRSFESIRKTCDRAAALTRQLLAFSRQQILQARPLNINTVIRDLEAILGRLITEDISFKMRLSENLGNIMADTGQIEQIILNLVVNARDAMPKGGRITIETENVHLDKPLTSAMLRAEPGHYVLLTVRDTGAGMDRETQARIFEPFFTTKGSGKGTGLGLSTVFGIISQCKGTIWIFSEPNRGTTFKIYLPKTEEAIEQVIPVNEAPIITPNSANILVVEDQDELRELICESLSDCGYKVFEAENGQRALEMVQQRLRFDIVITDVIMPEMGGKELGERIQSLYPETRMLYLSGYTEETLTNHGISGSHPHFLEKPFSLNTLLEKVRVVLS